MARLLIVSMLVACLAGCSGTMPGPQSIQVSGAEEAYPADYKARALRALGDAASPGMSISAPQLTIGESAFGPKRWYVCVRGVATTAKPPTKLKPVLDLAGDVMRPAASTGLYEVIVVLRGNGSASQIKTFDSPLCASGSYEPLAAG
ncbi:hypothetical protein [Devosia aquimaris]|uniref:hypothetical protein n=1 Tax=Devosia aquimaris TaxID=2866214 RepID=UPI001CD172DA|nr:hypothetical protein [Devosia sp. CJK-A8-3]